MLDEENGYRLVFPGRKVGTTLEGVGLALEDLWCNALLR